MTLGSRACEGTCACCVGALEFEAARLDVASRPGLGVFVTRPLRVLGPAGLLSPTVMRINSQSMPSVL